jgi:hypothetical protein
MKETIEIVLYGWGIITLIVLLVAWLARRPAD